MLLSLHIVLFMGPKVVLQQQDESLVFILIFCNIWEIHIKITGKSLLFQLDYQQNITIEGISNLNGMSSLTKAISQKSW